MLIAARAFREHNFNFTCVQMIHEERIANFVRSVMRVSILVLVQSFHHQQSTMLHRQWATTGIPKVQNVIFYSGISFQWRSVRHLRQLNAGKWILFEVVNDFPAVSWKSPCWIMVKPISERDLCWSSNYHWQDNLSANMLYFIKSLFNRSACVIIISFILLTLRLSLSLAL